jgi:YggT family protein
MEGNILRWRNATLTYTIVSTILKGAGLLINIYYYALIITILLSWLPQLQENKIARFIYNITDPYLAIFRRFIPPFGMIDFSPIIAFFVYSWLSQFLLRGLTTVLMFFF